MYWRQLFLCFSVISVVYLEVLGSILLNKSLISDFRWETTPDLQMSPLIWDPIQGLKSFKLTKDLFRQSFQVGNWTSRNTTQDSFSELDFACLIWSVLQ